MFIGFNFVDSQTKPYKTISQFNGNVMNYLNYNVQQRADFYKGKTIAALLSDLEIEPIGFDYIMQTNNSTPDVLCAIYLYFSHYEPNEFSELKDEYLVICFEKPITPQEFHKVKDDSIYSNFIWSQKYYNFFKDMIIEKVFFNSYKESNKSKNLPNK